MPFANNIVLFQWKLKQNTNIFIHGNDFKMSATCQPFSVALNVLNPFQNYNLPSWLLYYIEYLLWPHSCDAIRIMMTSSKEKKSALLALCAGKSPVTGEFPSQRPVTRSFDVSFDLRLNKRLSKQSWGWFESPSRPLWRHCNDTVTSV